MIEIAENLSFDIPHIRIDFYIIDDKPIVGGMSFFHADGLQKCTPEEWG